jgi:hypothetical protein
MLATRIATVTASANELAAARITKDGVSLGDEVTDGLTVQELSSVA